MGCVPIIISWVPKRLLPDPRLVSALLLRFHPPAEPPRECVSPAAGDPPVPRSHHPPGARFSRDRLLCL